MKKLLKWAAVGATALLLSPLALAQTPPGTTVTGTVVKTPKTETVTIVKTTPPPPGYKVCYMPVPRTVEGSRTVTRCGPYGRCQEFRVTREFDVIAYKDCHIEKYSCSRGYKKFGWYPNLSETKQAVIRCHKTVSSTVPGEWRISY